MDEDGSPDDSRGTGSQIFAHREPPPQKYDVVGEEDFQQRVESKRTRSDGTISEHEIKTKIHDETLRPIAKASTTPRRSTSPERVSKSSGRSTPRRSVSPRKLDTPETKSPTPKTRRSVSPESVEMQTQTPRTEVLPPRTEAPPPRTDAPPPPPPPPPLSPPPSKSEFPCPVSTEDFPPPRTFDSHRDIRRSTRCPRRHPCHSPTGFVYHGFDDYESCRIIPRGNDGAAGNGDLFAFESNQIGPNWFVLYGTDYGPVLISKDQLRVYEEKADGRCSRKASSTESGPFTPMLTAEYGPFVGDMFDGLNNPREVAVIYDRENKYKEVLCKQVPTYAVATSAGSCVDVDAYGGVRKPRRSLPSATVERRYVETACGSDDREEALGMPYDNKSSRNIEHLTTRMCDLETQVSSLALEKCTLRDKLTQATLMINELTQHAPSHHQKCTNTEPMETEGDEGDFDVGICAKTDAEIRKADRAYISHKKKAIELQTEIRELKLELKHLNDERLKLEMQQRQDERCKQELYEELEASRKIEQEMKTCFQYLERQHQKNEDEVQSTRLKLAALIQTLHPDSKPMVDVLLRESTKTLQCILEKLVSSIHDKYLQTRNELDDTLEELRRVKVSVSKAETAAQGNNLKVQSLKEKLRQLKESMSSSMTDLSYKVKSREKDLDCAQEKLQELRQQCSDKEHIAKKSHTCLERLENQLRVLEVERDQCLQQADEQRQKCKQRVDRLKDKYQNKIKCLMERLQDACHNCDVLREKVLQLQFDVEERQDNKRLPTLLNQLEQSCKEATKVMDNLQHTIQSRDDSDISLCKKRLDDLDGKVCKVAGDCNINQCKTPALQDLASRLNDALKLIEILKNNTQTNDSLKKRSWTSCRVLPHGIKAVPSLTHASTNCRAIERSFDDKAAAVQQHMARAQAWAQNVLQSSRNPAVSPCWASPCPPPPPPPQAPFCNLFPSSPVFYNNYPCSPFTSFPASPRYTTGTVQMPTTLTSCNFVDRNSPCNVNGCANNNDQDELNVDTRCSLAPTTTSPTMTYQLSSRTIGIAKHDVVFPNFTKTP